MKWIAIAAILAPAIGTTVAPAWADGDYLSWEGKWKVNFDKTHYPPTVPITSDEMDVTKDDGQTLQFSGVAVIGGKSSSASFSGAYDNKPHPLGDGQTLTYHHVSKTTFTSIRKAADGTVTERASCTLTTDGKAFTCHVELPMPDGKTVTIDEFFDRVS